MEVDVAEDDIERETDCVKDLSQRPGSLIRGAIAACRPENPDPPFRPISNACSPIPSSRGFRRVLHVVPDELSERPLFRENLTRLARTRPHLRFLRAAASDRRGDRDRRSQSEVQFILDHCGVPAVKDGLSEVWTSGMTEICQAAERRRQDFRCRRLCRSR